MNFLSACAGESQATSVNTTVAATQPNATEEIPSPAVALDTETEALTQMPEGLSPEVIVYTSDLPDSAIAEFEIWNDPAAAGGRLLGITNKGDELDPPPENDPHVTFEVQVEGSIPYRCWIHMLVGTPKGKSTANVVWVQFLGAVDKANREVFMPGSNSYLTATGSMREGWEWVGCDPPESVSPINTLIHFQSSGEISVRLQAGMEGVGFDQFLLSPAQFLDHPPSDAILEK